MNSVFKNISEENASRLEQSYRDGSSLVAIAKVIGCSAPTVGRFLNRKRGVVIRPKGRRPKSNGATT